MHTVSLLALVVLVVSALLLGVAKGSVRVVLYLVIVGAIAVFLSDAAGVLHL